MAASTLGAITAALAGLVLLGPVAVHRPVLGRQILTLLWGTGLIVTSLVQGLMALTAGTSVTDPQGMLTQTLAGLAGEALLALATIAWLRPRANARARHHDPSALAGTHPRP